MKHRFAAIFFCFALTVALNGCSRGIHSGSGGLPESSKSTSAEVSSSDQVVKVTASPVQVMQSRAANAVLRLSILPGYHVNANPATYPYLIATSVTPATADGLEVGSPSYPAAKQQKFQFAEEPLAVYDGETTISLALRAQAGAQTGPRSLPVTVRVQACDDEKCYPPANVAVTIPVEVK
jgi:hypothetical protein